MVQHTSTTISAQELHERLGDDGLVVFDCRHSLADFGLGRQLYDQSHVPGAFFADVESDLAGSKTGSNGRHPLPDPTVFAGFLGACGVGDQTHVVAYDGGADIFAARLWFLCRWIGHDAAAILDGGFSTWNALSYPTSSQAPTTASGRALTIRLRPELLVDADFVERNLHAPQTQLVDARAKERYSGEVEPIDPVAGHIPGAKQRWFKDNFDAQGLLKSPEQLRTEFAQLGLDPERTVHQCGSGVSSAVNQLAMEAAGLRGSRIYNGSWSEWIADPTRPIETGT